MLSIIPKITIQSYSCREKCQKKSHGGDRKSSSSLSLVELDPLSGLINEELECRIELECRVHQEEK